MKAIFKMIKRLEKRAFSSVLQLLTLDESSRQKILRRFPPKFQKVIAHHVTYYYGASVDREMPDVDSIKVIGYISDEYIEAAICEINGKRKSPDGRIFHVTISLDPSHRQPKDVNKLLYQGKEWEQVAPFPLSVHPEKRFMS